MKWQCLFDHLHKFLKAIKYVDEVILEESWDQKIKDVQEHDVDVFVMGDDWKGQFDFLKDYCEVVYLPRTEGISTTKIKDDFCEATTTDSTVKVGLEVFED